MLIEYLDITGHCGTLMDKAGHEQHSRFLPFHNFQKCPVTVCKVNKNPSSKIGSTTYIIGS